eukprot:m.113675 g.113675  ORF g.113675 m.113675 type:complete len:574 (-) comp12802_c1_seq1:922-2643(-)
MDFTKAQSVESVTSNISAIDITPFLPNTNYHHRKKAIRKPKKDNAKRLSLQYEDGMTMVDAISQTQSEVLKRSNSIHVAREPEKFQLNMNAKRGMIRQNATVEGIQSNDNVQLHYDSDDDNHNDTHFEKEEQKEVHVVKLMLEDSIEEVYEEEQNRDQQTRLQQQRNDQIRECKHLEETTSDLVHKIAEIDAQLEVKNTAISDHRKCCKHIESEIALLQEKLNDVLATLGFAEEEERHLQTDREALMRELDVTKTSYQNLQHEVRSQEELARKDKRHQPPSRFSALFLEPVIAHNHPNESNSNGSSHDTDDSIRSSMSNEVGHRTGKRRNDDVDENASHDIEGLLSEESIAHAIVSKESSRPLRRDSVVSAMKEEALGRNHVSSFSPPLPPPLPPPTTTTGLSSNAAVSSSMVLFLSRASDDDLLSPSTRMIKDKIPSSLCMPHLLLSAPIIGDNDETDDEYQDSDDDDGDDDDDIVGVLEDGRDVVEFVALDQQRKMLLAQAAVKRSSAPPPPALVPKQDEVNVTDHGDDDTDHDELSFESFANTINSSSRSASPNAINHSSSNYECDGSEA